MGVLQLAKQPVADGKEMKTEQLHPKAHVFNKVTVARQTVGWGGEDILIIGVPLLTREMNIVSFSF